MGEATQLDIENPPALLAYLRVRGLADSGSPGPRVQVLTGGVSNRTVLVTNYDGPDLVIKQALPKLRVPDEWFCSTDRVHREAIALKLLQRVEPRGVRPAFVPAFVFEDRPNNVLAMEAVPQPHENWKTMLLAGRASAGHFAQFGRMLARIHSFRPREDELAELSDRSFFEALRIEPYYLTSARRVPEASAFLEDLVARTRARQDVLVHGDYSPKNVLVRDERLTLLDFEVAHLGDAGFDIGFCLAHFLAKYLHLPQHRPNLLGCVHKFLLAYRQACGSKYDDERSGSAAAHTLGCLLARVAGRSQLEYLGAYEKLVLRDVTVSLMQRDLRRPDDVCGAVAEAICRSFTA